MRLEVCKEDKKMIEQKEEEEEEREGKEIMEPRLNISGATQLESWEGQTGQP